MPAGITNPALGYVTFAAVKFTGYSIAALGISRAYSTRVSPVLVGGVRTVIGLAAGAAYWALTQLFHESLGRLGIPGYLVGLLPIRLLEWWLVVWLFYDRRLVRPARGWATV